MSKLIRKSNKGFTLIELMIVVAIIGILAAIAIPNFMRFQLKAKSSEGKVNIAAIRTAQESYLAEFGSYVPALVSPGEVPGAAKVPYANGAGEGLGFEKLGWSPEGRVFFQYAVQTNEANTVYTISAAADIDGDGPTTPANQQFWGYVKGAPGVTSVVGVHTQCDLDGIAGDLTNTVGPCVSTSGQSVF